MYGVIVKSYGHPEYRSVELYSFSDFVDYVKANKDVWRVVVPHTGYGYDTGLIEAANSEWLETHYPRAVQNHCFNVTFSRSKFLRDPEVQDIIKGLAEDYPLLSDDIHSRLQTEAQLEAWTSWIASDIDSDLTPEQLEDVLAYFGTAMWEVMQFDTDGTTVYVSKAEIEQWQQVISELSGNSEA